MAQAEHVAADGVVGVVASVGAVALPAAIFVEGSEADDIAAVTHIKLVHPFDEAVTAFEVALFEKPV